MKMLIACVLVLSSASAAHADPISGAIVGAANMALASAGASLAAQAAFSAAGSFVVKTAMGIAVTNGISRCRRRTTAR